jgi:myo-inositol-1(or 4)-monophosphatase
MHPVLNIAKRAALEAGKIMLRNWERLDTLQITEKQRIDFVSEVDLQSEQEIIRTLNKIYPDHAILAEESGESGSSDEYQWIIDPLDGTANYLHGFPHFAVSIGLKHRGRLEAGLIYDPIKQDIFTASRGQGAQLNDRRIRIKPRPSLDGAMVATGIPARQMKHKPAFLDMMGDMMSGGAQLRRTGSAALDLAYVAAGRLDGFWEIGLSPWDMAAGAVMVLEAGGLVGDFSGDMHFLESGNIVCGSPKVFKGLLQAIQPHKTPDLMR